VVVAGLKTEVGERRSEEEEDRGSEGRKSKVEDEDADPSAIHNLRSTICNPSFLRPFVRFFQGYQDEGL
jgi:hypothetical protein